MNANLRFVCAAMLFDMRNGGESSRMKAGQIEESEAQKIEGSSDFPDVSWTMHVLSKEIVWSTG